MTHLQSTNFLIAVVGRSLQVNFYRQYRESRHRHRLKFTLLSKYIIAFAMAAGNPQLLTPAKIKYASYASATSGGREATRRTRGGPVSSLSAKGASFTIPIGQPGR